MSRTTLQMRLDDHSVSRKLSKFGSTTCHTIFNASLANSANLAALIILQSSMLLSPTSAVNTLLNKRYQFHQPQYLCPSEQI